MNEQDIEIVCQEIKQLLIEKNMRYGQGNIARFGEKGVVIRSFDKVDRLKTLLFDKVEATTDEAIEDSWRDLAGYAIIGLLFHRGKW